MNAFLNDPNSAAYVASGAFVSSTARVHAGAWIGDGVELYDDVIVGPGAVLGFAAPERSRGTLRIGKGTFVGAGVQIEPDVEIGAECRIETRTVLRAGTRIGANAYIGPSCLVMGRCQIGDHVSLYAEVHICEYARLEPFCHIMPGVKLLNAPCPPTTLHLKAPTIAHYAVIGVNAIIWSGVRVGRHAVVGAASIVKNDVADYMLVRGSPAKPVCDSRIIQIEHQGRWIYPYPWERLQLAGEDLSKPAAKKRPDCGADGKNSRVEEDEPPSLETAF